VGVVVPDFHFSRPRREGAVSPRTLPFRFLLGDASLRPRLAPGSKSLDC
jgi:hypothetical protein